MISVRLAFCYWNEKRARQKREFLTSENFVLTWEMRTILEANDIARNGVS
ncbi:MAG: hypothetical protein KDD64_15065 [Bdellovibrionales bacterium]|nr:hypothetical protein [Bdellovibrionales bacterium]